jgi:hypothetical protein
MKVFSVLSALLISVSSVTLFADQTVGFSGGENYEATPLSGSISVQCNQGVETRTAFFDCHEEILMPYDFDYFVGPKGVDADEVVLVAKRQDGSTREKKGAYSSATARSKNQFNLWIATVFQRPLLNHGKNEVTYTLNKNGKAVSQGTFNVYVTNGQPAQCQRRHYFSSVMSDCDAPYSSCQKYFRDENFCK